TSLLSAIAILTMTVGNVTALLQKNVKRMLAYSSIAHAGYILVAVVAGGADGASAALFYLAVYSFMNLGAFGILTLLGREQEEPAGEPVGVSRALPGMLALVLALIVTLWWGVQARGLLETAQRSVLGLL